MTSELFRVVYQEQLAELAQQREQERERWQQELSRRDQELAQERERWQQELVLRERERELALRERDQEREGWQQKRQMNQQQQMVEEALILRFPMAPLKLLLQVRQIRDPEALQALHRGILTAPDLARLEQTLALAAFSHQPPDTGL